MDIEEHQLELLRALLESESALKADGRPAEWMLLDAGFGGHRGLKPGLPSGAPSPTEADIRDLVHAGFLHQLTAGKGVTVKFALSASGRTVARKRPAVVELSTSSTGPSGPAPGFEEVLGWLAEVEDRWSGKSLDGSVVMNEAIASFPDPQ